MPKSTTKTKSGGTSAAKRAGLWLGATLLIAAVVFLAVGYINARKEVKHLSDPKAASEQAAKDIVAKASKLVALPTDESPTIATVKDVSKLKTQAFFKNAHNGDKVLIYTKAKKAAIYRPSTNKIIEIAPVNLGSSSSTSSSSTDSTTPATPEANPAPAQ